MQTFCLWGDAFSVEGQEPCFLLETQALIIIIQYAIHLLGNAKWYSIPNHFDSHSCQFHVFIYKNAFMYVSETFAF